MNTEQTQYLLDDQCFSQIIELVHKLTGITISSNRKTMVQGRLRKRLRSLNLSSFESYLEFVSKDSAEQVFFIDSITTNETYFFRTPRVWDYIANDFLPSWYKENPQKTLYLWSAASSSGEEAYSLSILCTEFQKKHPHFKFEIYASDISNEMISQCQNAIYNEKAISHFRANYPEIFKKYIVPSGDTYSITAAIKNRVHFKQHNLFSNPKFEVKFDLVLIRNVLIYFTSHDQERVLAKVANAMNSQSTLIIGESESLSHIKTDFKHKAPLVYSYTQLREKEVA